MATIVNDRDVLLQAAADRDIDPSAGKVLLLTTDTALFHVDNVGVPTPGSINFVAHLVNITGTVSFVVSSGDPLTGSGNSRALDYDDMSVPSVTVTASVTENGITYTAVQIVSKVRDGVNGDDGLDGVSGLSAAVCYSLVTGFSLSTTPSTSTVSGTAYPTTGTWGETSAWQATPPTPTAGESVFQSNGSYDPVLDETTWSVPFLSSLRVGELSAISANLGKITAGSIRGVNVNAASHTTKGSYLTSAASAAASTLNVEDTSDFFAPVSGTYTQSGTTTVSVTTSTAHNLHVNEWIRPAIGSGSAAAGIVARVSSTPTSTTFTYISSTNPTTSGSISIPGQGIIIDTTNDADEFTYTGKTSTTLTGCSGVLAHNDGATVLPFYKAMVIDGSVNDIRCYADRGDGYITQLVFIGGESTVAVATFGDNGVGSSRDGINAFSGSGTAVSAYSLSGPGVTGTSNTDTGVIGSGNQIGVQGISVILSSTAVGVQGNSDKGCGVEGVSSTGYGGRFYGNATKGNLFLPHLTSNPSSVVADQFANINGKLCYSDGTDWRRVSDDVIV